jgi:hypothetical protein
MRPSILLPLVAAAACGGNYFHAPPQPDAGDDFGGDDAPPFDNFGVPPVFGPTVTQAVAPPPVSGGTLTVLASGLAVAADPDRDHVYVVDVTARAKVADVALLPGDEPGRVIEDGAGRVHVVLRGGGALATIDPATWMVTARRNVCPAPRGAAWDPTSDAVLVACAGGELVSLPAAGGTATRTVRLDRDLRDVAIVGGQVYVTRFRTAEILTLDATGAITARTTPATFSNDFVPDGAWRMAVASGQIYVLHQRATQRMVDTHQHGGYGGGDPCSDPIVHATVTHFVPGQTPVAGPVIEQAVVPVDMAVSSTGTIAVVSMGNSYSPDQPVVLTLAASHTDDGHGCDGDDAAFAGGFEPTAVAYTHDNQLLVQSREPAELIVAGSANITLSSTSREDTGHAIFHANASAGIACASCHLEGGDDGRIWGLDIGARRTQSLRGGILGTEPFHWDGEQPDFPTLVNDVFVNRMAGPSLASDQQAALSSWVNAIPLLRKAPGNAAAIARGQTLFQDATNVGCTTCHNGPKLTNNATVDVGTGAPFQVPSLRGVVERPPYLHDGRAATLTDRFSSGGGDKHGHTSQLTAAQISDLVAYLSSL